MVKFLAFLVFALLAPIAVACDLPQERDCDDDAMRIFLPESDTTVVPNVRLENFQYTGEKGRDDDGITNQELMRLHRSVKPIAAAAFADSKVSYDVMIRYTINPKTPATIEMQTNAPESENKRLRIFHDKAAQLVDFHSLSKTIYVVFHYSVNPGSQ